MLIFSIVCLLTLSIGIVLKRKKTRLVIVHESNVRTYVGDSDLLTIV